MKFKIYFITGVCGVGKSTLIPHLKLILNKRDYDIHDFDERGVPSNTDEKWRKRETEYWVNLGEENIKNNISTIICGFSNPEEIIHNNKKHIKFILLDASNGTIKQRIIGRYQTKKSRQELRRASGDSVKEFIEDNINFLKTLKNICQNDKRCNIIDTTNKLPKEITEQIVKVIEQRHEKNDPKKD